VLAATLGRAVLRGLATTEGGGADGGGAAHRAWPKFWSGLSVCACILEDELAAGRHLVYGMLDSSLWMTRSANGGQYR
jgi:hypothetical protein